VQTSNLGAGGNPRVTTSYLGPSGRPRSRQSHPEFPPWGLGGLRRYRSGGESPGASPRVALRRSRSAQRCITPPIGQRKKSTVLILLPIWVQKNLITTGFFGAPDRQKIFALCKTLADLPSS